MEATLGLLIPETLKERLEQYAKDNAISMSAAVRLMLKRGLDNAV